jgi:hypothetical protein
LEVDHLRTIDDMFAILAYWFRGEDFKTFFPIGSYVKTTVCPLKAAILAAFKEYFVPITL